MRQLMRQSRTFFGIGWLAPTAVRMALPKRTSRPKVDDNYSGLQHCWPNNLLNLWRYTCAASNLHVDAPTNRIKHCKGACQGKNSQQVEDCISEWPAAYACQDGTAQADSKVQCGRQPWLPRWAAALLAEHSAKPLATYMRCNQSTSRCTNVSHQTLQRSMPRQELAPSRGLHFRMACAVECGHGQPHCKPKFCRYICVCWLGGRVWRGGATSTLGKFFEGVVLLACKPLCCISRTPYDKITWETCRRHCFWQVPMTH
jgi:hypothetical protein